MLKILFIAIGGIFGTLLRSFMAHNIALSMSFNILLINYLGSFLAGCFFQFFKALNFHATIQNLIMVGFLGAFTTFSTYSLEAVKMFLAGEYKTGIWYIIIGNIGAVVATLVGIFLVKQLMFFIKS
ncbi:CrcB family protein [Candidatus Dependentiae bacterium]|nr:CrcB family protein [Candidatus Dependentiae bacterium]MBU4387655.1 CrcB family protein [Candidatus Dependentiae bacterium]MCG2756131.1 CrcB family protein [Candidatus Dependentiae bacterium]